MLNLYREEDKQSNRKSSIIENVKTSYNSSFIKRNSMIRKVEKAITIIQKDPSNMDMINMIFEAINRFDLADGTFGKTINYKKLEILLDVISKNSNMKDKEEDLHKIMMTCPEYSQSEPGQ